ncbi:TetR family transcriptional regulator C-terminal domain-containing protein [Streptomyces sioyaensis]|uniref:TetR family transcriptional regulator C-terminal domain-containing protein n=1 Tax=Streptomyces sioyaensis TaxID=67364 RepID=UPI00378B7330
MLTRHRARLRQDITGCVERGTARGDLSPATDAPALAAAFHSFLLGLSTQIRDGLDSTTLDAAVTQIMHLWDTAAAHPGHPTPQRPGPTAE